MSIKGVSDAEQSARVIVCGGRDFADKHLCFVTLDEVLAEYSTIEIVSGNAKGADSFGEVYAKENNIEVSVFPPDWKIYGRAAGPIRNKQMLMYALETNALVVAFGDGVSRGTKNMIEQAKEAGAKVIVVSY